MLAQIPFRAQIPQASSSCRRVPPIRPSLIRRPKAGAAEDRQSAPVPTPNPSPPSPAAATASTTSQDADLGPIITPIMSWIRSINSSQAGRLLCLTIIPAALLCFIALALFQAALRLLRSYTVLFDTVKAALPGTESTAVELVTAVATIVAVAVGSAQAVSKAQQSISTAQQSIRALQQLVSGIEQSQKESVSAIAQSLEQLSEKITELVQEQNLRRQQDALQRQQDALQRQQDQGALGSQLADIRVEMSRAETRTFQSLMQGGMKRSAAESTAADQRR